MANSTVDSAAASILRALTLLEAASSDSRLKGPSDGTTPLHWPLVVRAAQLHLTHALARLEQADERDREIAQLRTVLRDYLDACDACTLAAADPAAWEGAHAHRESVRRRAREVVGSAAVIPDTLARIMALQAVENRTAEQDEELSWLEAEWHNRAIDPRECAVRR